MKTLRHLGSMAFVAGIFVSIFAGIPWYVVVTDDPVVPWWLRLAIFCLLGGILVVLLSLTVEQLGDKVAPDREIGAGVDGRILLSNTPTVPGRPVAEVLGLVQGHTVFAIWIGNDLSAIVRLVLGGELTEYTEMMGKARVTATSRMVVQANEMQADAIINVRYMTTSVVGTASELFAYGTAVRLSE